jgi:hypothetical protein
MLITSFLSEVFGVLLSVNLSRLYDSRPRSVACVRITALFAGLLILAGLIGPGPARCMTAQEVLDQVIKHNFLDSFRVVLDVKTFKGKKPIAKSTLWLMGRTQGHYSEFFLDFDDPKESKGLRFLIRMKPDQVPTAFMYLPATGKTLPLAVDDPTVDIGGTGLSMDDLQGFVPKGGETMALLKDEKVDHRDCYVIKVTLPGDGGERLMWVTKEGFLVLKTQQSDTKGKVKRTFRVVHFFKTEKGTEFPREEEITIPDRDIRIKVTQEHAVFGIEFPEEVMDPQKFGTFKWRQ